MGESKAQQKDALKRRLQKLRELKAAGIEMTTEEAQLLEGEAEDGTIEEEVTTEDVMRDLQVSKTLTRLPRLIEPTSHFDFSNTWQPQSIYSLFLILLSHKS